MNLPRGGAPIVLSARRGVLRFSRMIRVEQQPAFEATVVANQILLESCFRPVPTLTFGPVFHAWSGLQYHLLARRRIRTEGNMNMNVAIAGHVTVN